MTRTVDPVWKRRLPRSQKRRAMTAVPAVANTEQCPCGRPLDPTVHHDDTPDGRQLCEQCCPTCITTTTTKENTP